MKPISITEVRLEDKEIREVGEVLRSGQLREGTQVREFEEAFCKKFRVKHAVAVSSGTAALHLAYLALLKPGDEVLVPSFTFIATASMAALTGAKPVFCDVDPQTMTISVDEVKRKLSTKTRAIVGVHLFGNACDISGLEAIAKQHNLLLIWDAAQSLGTLFNGRDISNYADIVCFSFYPSKNMTTGEGGMLTTSNAKLADKLVRLKNHGRTDKYRHELIGLNYRMTNMEAVLGLAQLAKLDGFIDARRRIAAQYEEAFKQSPLLQTQRITDNCTSSYNYYSMVIKSGSTGISRDEFVDQLKAKGVPAAVHYPMPLHEQPCFAPFRTDDLPASSELAQSIFSLPMHPYLDQDQVKYIIQSVLALIPQNA